MSFKVTGLVYERGPKLGGWRFLMAAMAENADDQGFCFPGVALLAEKTCASERTVLRRIAAMQAAGWLTVEVRSVHRRGTPARNRVNAYQLNMARLRGETAGSPAGEATPKASASPVAPRCDTVSCRQAGDDVTDGTVAGVDDVTKSTRRCDKPGIAIRKNRQEPRNNDEPRDSPQPPVPGGAAVALVPDVFAAEARRVLRECGLSDPRLEGAVERGLRLAAGQAGQHNRPCSELARTLGDAMVLSWRRMQSDLEAGLLRHGWGPRKFFAGPWRGVGWPYEAKALAAGARRNIGTHPPEENAAREQARREREAEDAAYLEARGREAAIRARRSADPHAALTMAEFQVWMNPSKAYRRRAS